MWGLLRSQTTAPSKKGSKIGVRRASKGPAERIPSGPFHPGHVYKISFIQAFSPILFKLLGFPRVDIILTFPDNLINT